ncbi:S1/P1 nuclease [Mucilaginibacter sp. PAMB04274]|uniref:S1/P1 nuclease n=1 Tax=Mucilaginibacter sp. PAMB04274 TaxID=3138568 RepID=UPI0031F6ED36
MSWGSIGHRTVALIADNHLNPKAKAVVKELLGEQSMADVSSWADQVRNQPEFKHTEPWHYVNAPLGLSYHDFAQLVTNQSKDNVYTAIEKEIAILRDGSSTHLQQADALKFIIHFVGDLHQPMHVSRAEDKGGNTIQLQYEGQGTNLHSLWDGKMIATSGMTDIQLAKADDNLTPAAIAKLQKDPLMQWLWESYQISSKLYAEIEQNNKPGKDYYDSHMPIVHERLQKAGIRLAGLLNEVLAKVKVSPATDAAVTTQPSAPLKINAKDAASHVGETVSVTSKVFGTKAFGGMTLLNFGGEYPNAPLTIVLRGDVQSLATQVDGKVISVVGKLINYKGKPEIEVNDPKSITVAR